MTPFSKPFLILPLGLLSAFPVADAFLSTARQANTLSSGTCIRIPCDNFEALGQPMSSTTFLKNSESAEDSEAVSEEAPDGAEEEAPPAEEEKTEDPEVVALKEEIASLESALRTKRLEAGRIEDEADEYTKSGYYRKCAEMDNFRKRRDLAFQNSKFVGRASVMKKFLPVMDELKKLGEEYENDEFAKGYDALRRDFDLVMKNKLNLEEYDIAVGQPLNRFREAVVGYEYSEEVAKGSILRQVSSGLEVKGNVVRFAECIVSKGSETEEKEAQEKKEKAEETKAEAEPTTETEDESD